MLMVKKVHQITFLMLVEVFLLTFPRGSKKQLIISLSIIEEEYISLSTAAWLKELKHTIE